MKGKAFRMVGSRRDVWNRLSAFYRQAVVPSSKKIIIVSHDDALSVFYAMWLGPCLNMLNQCNLSGISGGVSILYLKIRMVIVYYQNGSICRIFIVKISKWIKKRQTAFLEHRSRPPQRTELLFYIYFHKE